MEFRAQATAISRRAASGAPIRKPRRCYRQRLNTLAYVNLDQANGGVLRDVSEAGLGMQSVAPVLVNQQVKLRFELGARLHLELLGRIVWTGTQGQAGVEFIAPSERSQRLLRQWIFLQLLTRAHSLFSMDSIFSSGHPPEEAPELRFSGEPRQSIRLENAKDLLLEADDTQVQLGWFPVHLSSHALARLVDGLALTVGLLLFCVVTLAVVQVVPPWPIALALVLGSAGLLACLYWLLFAFSMGQTPGARLASIGSGGSRKRRVEAEPVRFR